MVGLIMTEHPEHRFNLLKNDIIKIKDNIRKSLERHGDNEEKRTYAGKFAPYSKTETTLNGYRIFVKRREEISNHILGYWCCILDYLCKFRLGGGLEDFYVQLLTIFLCKLCGNQGYDTNNLRVI
jgi:hypothetical protein